MKRFFLIFMRIVRRVPLDKLDYALDLYIFSERTKLQRAGITPPAAPEGIVPQRFKDTSKHRDSDIPRLDTGTRNHAEAAEFLVKSKKQLTRYREEGKIAFMRDEAGHYHYRDADLERLFVLLHGYPKGGFRK